MTSTFKVCLFVIIYIFSLNRQNSWGSREKVPAEGSQPSRGGTFLILGSYLFRKQATCGLLRCFQYYWVHPNRVLQDCTICMEALAGPSGYKGPGVGGISRAESVGRLSQCGHQYHLQCLVAMYNNGNKDGSLQCPTCKTIYGVKTGNQPPGKMEYHVIPHSLPGHPDCKTIRIIYNIPPGIQVLVWLPLK